MILRKFMLLLMIDSISLWETRRVPSSLRSAKRLPQYKCFQMEGNSWWCLSTPTCRSDSSINFLSIVLFSALVVSWEVVGWERLSWLGVQFWREIDVSCSRHWLSGKIRAVLPAEACDALVITDWEQSFFTNMDRNRASKAGSMRLNSTMDSSPEYLHVA